MFLTFIIMYKSVPEEIMFTSEPVCYKTNGHFTYDSQTFSYRIEGNT